MDADALPRFRFHPDPLQSGSVAESEDACQRCGERRGYLYAGPVYAETDLADRLCPWCIADGSAHRAYAATFVDNEAFVGDVPATSVEEITERTPGYHAWQDERWPACCGDATAFLAPVGIGEIRERHREAESTVLGHIVHEVGISGGAARRLLEALRRDVSPTAYLFRCLRCAAYRVHIDQA